MYEISDNHEVFLAEVEVARKQRVVFRIHEKLACEEPKLAITLYAALIKFERLELIIEKATELGVAAIVPVRTGRTEPGLERAAEKRINRWRRIGLEASQQSRRVHLPEISGPVTFREVMKVEAGLRLLLDEDRTGTPILQAATTAKSVALLVGPEGGWTEAERSAAREANWVFVSLGPRILRAETAAISALAVLNAALT